jgi:hypothetical protein
MKIKLDYQKIKDQDEETFELFREFIDRVVCGEVFAGSDPKDYDILDVIADIEIEIETEDEYHNQNGMTDRNGNEFIRRDEGGDDDDDWRDSPFNDFSDDDIDAIYRD